MRDNDSFRILSNALVIIITSFHPDIKYSLDIPRINFHRKIKVVDYVLEEG